MCDTLNKTSSLYETKSNSPDSEPRTAFVGDNAALAIIDDEHKGKR